MSSEKKASRPVSRRTLVGAAVWATPVVAVVAATPAHAVGSPGTSLPKGSIDIQWITFDDGGGGRSPRGNFVVQANKGVSGDQRTVVLMATAKLQRLVDGSWEDVGSIPLTPSSYTKKLDGGSGQFQFAGGPTLTTGATYRVVVDASGTQSDGVALAAHRVSGEYTPQ